MIRIFTILVVLMSSWSSFSQNKIDMYLKADSLLSTDKPEAAEEYLIQLSRDNPHNEDYHYSLGEIYYNKSDFRNSIVHFKKAQEFGLEYRSNYFLACNYIGINKPDSAVYYLTKHVVTPMNGNFMCEEVLYDTIFQELHNLPGYIKLLPPEIIDSLNVKGNWIKDIEYLSLMLKKTHYDPFCKLNESDWDNAIKELKQDVPSLNNYQILVRLHQFVAMIGDGHTSVYMQKSILPEKTLPILTQVFSDGCYIVGAMDGYKELLGAKIITVNGLDFESVYDKVNSVISVDNEMGYKYLFAWNFMRMNLVHGLGLSQSRDSLEITYLLDGVEGEMVIRSVKKSSKLFRYHAHYEKKYPLFLENYHRGNRKSYWYKYITDENILYVQINGITSLKNNPLPVFCDSINLLIDSLDISAFVLDIRNNGGGNTGLNKHILKVMLSDKINIKGKSFTVIGFNTFSAAQNLTSIIENYTETIFIGERTASKPRFNGETNPFRLPYSGLMVGASNVFHQHGYSADTRKWVSPDILVEFNFEHFKNGIDPVIEEIIKYTNN